MSASGINTFYTASDEINFIRFHLDQPSQRTRAELLRRYIASCEVRTNWVGINKDKVLAAARQMLREEEGGAAVHEPLAAEAVAS